MHQSKKHILVKGQKKLQHSCFEWPTQGWLYVYSTSQKLLSEWFVQTDFPIFMMTKHHLQMDVAPCCNKGKLSSASLPSQERNTKAHNIRNINISKRKNLFRESLSAGPIVPIQPEEGVQQLFHASRLFRSTRLPCAALRHLLFI